MKNILLATDLKTESNRALERAVYLASTLSSKLHVLHVCPVYALDTKKKYSVSLKQDAEEMIKISLAAAKGGKKVSTSITVIEGGEAFAEIIKHAEKIKAGLIVMGMHGKVKLIDMFVGTTIERVIRKGRRPILMVRDKPLTDYKNVLVGTDFSAGSKQVFKVAVELASKGVFHLVHTYGFTPVDLRDHMAWYTDDTMAKRANENLKKFVRKSARVLKKQKVEPQNIHLEVVRGKARSSLLRKAQKVQSDLIAIGTHSHVTLMPHKLGRTARDILSNPPCDVLIAKGL